MPETTADLILKGGLLLDAESTAPVAGDIWVEGGRISQIAPPGGPTPGSRVLDVTGLTVSPGFIDIHAHSDLTLLVDPRNEPKVHQGVTLELIGQDGLSYAPVPDAAVLDQLRRMLVAWNGEPDGVDWDWRSVAEYLERLDGASTSVAYLVPHGTVRLAVMGLEDRPATAGELARMREMVATALDEGAFGLSAGLVYTPSAFASTEELVALCEPVAERGGFFAPHHRSYGRGAVEAYTECIEIARRSGVDLHLTHVALTDASVRGRAGELLAIIDRARAAGVSITLDSYPYVAGSTYLHVYLPRWAAAGDPEAILARLRQPDCGERLARDMADRDWGEIVLASAESPRYRAYVGRTLADVGSETGLPPVEAYRDLLIAEELGAMGVRFSMSEEDVIAFMCDPGHMASSDGLLVGARPHPRGWGAFPRYLARYVRELGVLSLGQCIAKMTRLPALRLGLVDRGLLRPGFVADLVCFDPERVQDHATFEDPRRLPGGIPHVVVEGELVVHEGRHLGTRPGRALRAPAGRPRWRQEE